MKYLPEQILRGLKIAREKKGLNQRELSSRSGVPQSQISKIENGTVDLRISSLVALARSLDLELMLVPHTGIPAVQSIVRSSGNHSKHDAMAKFRAFTDLSRIQTALEHLPAVILQKKETELLLRQVRELQNSQNLGSGKDAIKDIYRNIKVFTDDPRNMEALHQANLQFRKLRNALAHNQTISHANTYVRPAYSLDENENNG